MGHIFQTFFPWGAMIVGIALVLWPPPRWSSNERLRRGRLAELNSGADEAYFEERRSLQAYGPSSVGPYRLWGGLICMLGVATFFLD
jgi:hypothetical protein